VQQTLDTCLSTLGEEGGLSRFSLEFRMEAEQTPQKAIARHSDSVTNRVGLHYLPISIIYSIITPTTFLL
jgi:hypothetical protein